MPFLKIHTNSCFFPHKTVHYSYLSAHPYCKLRAMNSNHAPVFNSLRKTYQSFVFASSFTPSLEAGRTQPDSWLEWQEWLLAQLLTGPSCLSSTLGAILVFIFDSTLGFHTPQNGLLSFVKHSVLSLTCTSTVLPPTSLKGPRAVRSGLWKH